MPVGMNVDIKWQEQDGIISFKPNSDKRSGLELVSHLKQNDFLVSDFVAKNLEDIQELRIPAEIVVLKGNLFTDYERTTKNICCYAQSCGLSRPSPEITGLIREKFTDKDLQNMGLWSIVTMHEYIDKSLFYAYRGDLGPCLGFCYDQPDFGWGWFSGFAFIRP